MATTISIEGRNRHGARSDTWCSAAFMRDRYEAVVESVPVGEESAVATYDLKSSIPIPIAHRLLGQLLHEAERRGDVKCAGPHDNPGITVAEDWQGLTWFREAQR